jgi:hypothetical protein
MINTQKYTAPIGTKVISYRNYRGSSGGIHNVRFLRANGVQEACQPGAKQQASPELTMVSVA